MTVQNSELIALVQIPLASLVKIVIKSYQNLLKNKGDREGNQDGGIVK